MLVNILVKSSDWSSGDKLSEQITTSNFEVSDVQHSIEFTSDHLSLQTSDT